MNPHRGQFRLAGTISAWTRLDAPTPKQARALRRAYRGLEPRVYGRYGQRQWAAALPRTRVIVKDPFALLSMAAVAKVTDALPVLIYRHPGAVLASYQRMGWHPDLAEIEAVAPDFEPLAADADTDDVDEMGWFWAVTHQIALAQLATVPRAVVVSHQELSLAGEDGVRILFDACELSWSERAAAEVAGWSDSAARTPDPAPGDRLHVMNRSPRDVEESWRKRLDPAVVERLELMTKPVLDDIERRRLRLSA